MIPNDSETPLPALRTLKPFNCPFAYGERFPAAVVLRLRHSSAVLVKVTSHPYLFLAVHHEMLVGKRLPDPVFQQAYNNDPTLFYNLYKTESIEQARQLGQLLHNYFTQRF